MSRVNLQLNSISLQSSTIVTSTIGDDSSPDQGIGLENITRRDGEKLISTSYRPKIITLTGRIKGSTMADLENNIDNFKRDVSVTDGRLDIEYAGSVRRFIVSAQTITIERAHYHLTFAPFVVSFITYDPPFGLNVSGLGGNIATNEAMSVVAQTGQAVESTISFDGSAKPKPIITYQIDNSADLDEIYESVLGKKNMINVGTYFTSGDRLVIDTENQVVLLNGRPVNFEGVFPEYEVGSNTAITTLADSSSIIDEQQTEVADFITINANEHLVFQGFQVSATTTYFQVEVYLRRDISVRSGQLTLGIYSASGNNPGPSLIANATKTINISDIPVEGGWIRFKFAVNPTLTTATDYRMVLTPVSLAGQGGSIYVGISRSNPYALGMLGFSLNNGSIWRTLGNIDLAFRVWKTTASMGWSIDKRIEYTKRYL